MMTPGSLFGFRGSFTVRNRYLFYLSIVASLSGPSEMIFIGTFR